MRLVKSPRAILPGVFHGELDSMSRGDVSLVQRPVPACFDICRRAPASSSGELDSDRGADCNA